jgi:hypothetical protein
MIRTPSISSLRRTLQSRSGVNDASSWADATSMLARRDHPEHCSINAVIRIQHGRSVPDASADNGAGGSPSRAA